MPRDTTALQQAINEFLAALIPHDHLLAARAVAQAELLVALRNNDAAAHDLEEGDAVLEVKRQAVEEELDALTHPTIGPTAPGPMTVHSKSAV